MATEPVTTEEVHRFVEFLGRVARPFYGKVGEVPIQQAMRSLKRLAAERDALRKRVAELEAQLNPNPGA